MHKAIFFDRDGTLIKTNISSRNTPISIKTKTEIRNNKTTLGNVKQIYNHYQNIIDKLYFCGLFESGLFGSLKFKSKSDKTPVTLTLTT